MKKEKEIEINYQNVDLLVTLEITGKHLPATQIDPEEFTDVEVVEVYAGNTDIIGIFYDVQLEEIRTLCLEKL